MKPLLIVLGTALLAGAVVAYLLHAPTVAVVLAVAGVVAVLLAVFRRYGRPGDFSRSGWTGS